VRVSPLEVGGTRDHLGMTDAKPDEPEDGDENPEHPADEPPADIGESGKELEPTDDEKPSSGSDVLDFVTRDETSSGAEVLDFLTSNSKPFFDVGKIVPTIDFAKLTPTFNIDKIVGPSMQPFLDSLAKIDFGYKPVLDAAILKSLENVVPRAPVLPPGFFDKFLDFKYPELELHADTLRAIDNLVVPSRRALEPIDDVLEAELVDDEPRTDIELPPSIAEQQLALHQRSVELLEQSIASNVQSNERADASQARAERADERAARADERAEAATKRGNTIALVSIIIGVVFGVGAIITAIIVG
jgi:hypothetical protein